MSDVQATFIPWDNPMGTDGFEFIEYAASDPEAMGKMFGQLGFTAVARHRRKKVTLYRQGEINFILNAEPDSFAQRFARLHGPSICAIAFRVADAGKAYARAISLGAWGYDSTGGPGELNIPAIKGIGDSMIYLVDRWRDRMARSRVRSAISASTTSTSRRSGTPQNPPSQPRHIDHLTHNVSETDGRVVELLQRLFNPRDPVISTSRTGHRNQVPRDDEPVRQDPHPDQRGRPGRGRPDPGTPRSLSRRRRQHIAMGSTDLYKTVDSLVAAGVAPLHARNVLRRRGQACAGARRAARELKRQHILIDNDFGRVLLQIFSENQFGPVFEFIQRKGNEGFGERATSRRCSNRSSWTIRRGVVKA
jgi:4-hydroxyphenylpyruvate dioxygenase